MKNKRFIAKILVLAMAFALMIPTPVLAKGGGGKLLKSVTVYSSYNETKGRWDSREKIEFKYDKKNYPKEIKTTDYEIKYGIPFSASQTVQKAKFKYKGKTPKSMKLKNTAGRLIDTRKYKKGWLTKSSYSMSGTDDSGVYHSEKNSSTISYTKKGLPKAGGYTYNEVDGTDFYNSSRTVTYTVSQKKGVPKLIKALTTSWNGSDNEGSWSGTQNADGTYTYTSSGGETYSNKEETVDYDYTKFNKKGLVIESGRLEVTVATGAEKYFPSRKVVYKSKKGKVVQATVYNVQTNYQTGVIEKETPRSLYKFKYTKKKASNGRYFRMINTELGYDTYFNWY